MLKFKHIFILMRKEEENEIIIFYIYLITQLFIYNYLNLYL